MTLWDASGRVKIERAKEHISQLDIASREFFDTNPYEVRFEPDRELEGYVVRIVQRELAPSLRWSAITADAVHNLRSSLDILWRMAIHGKVRTTRRAYFPIYDTAEEFKARQWGEPQRPNVRAAVDILAATKPYKGGNDALWALHALDTRDKHEMLTLTVGTFRSLLIKAFPDTTIYMQPEDFLSPVEDGAVMSRLAPDITTIPVDMHHEFVFEVTFAQGEILEGEAVLPTLHQFANMVDGIVDAFATAQLLT